MPTVGLDEPVRLFQDPNGFTLVCPQDRALLDVEGERALCPHCGFAFTRVDNVWRFLCDDDPGLEFLRDYRAVRRAEGWGSTDPDYYRRLPFVRTDDPQREIWRVRAANFRILERLVGAHRRILDLGAGNGWLAYRLGQRGCFVAPVDLSDDPYDGLGALKHYPVALTGYQADFAALPFADAQFDCIIYNASLHFARDLAQTVSAGLRVLASRGLVVVMDSPLYHAATSGQAMLAEKNLSLKERFGTEIVSDTIGFLTSADFERLGSALALEWHWYEPPVDLRWATRHWRARLRRQREPARFGLMVGKRIEGTRAAPRSDPRGKM